jgi:small-conductance mechanosensitive channel
MEFIDEIFSNIWIQRGVQALLVLAFSGIIYLVISKYLNKKEKSTARLFSQKKKKTFIRMTKSIFGAILACITLLMVLQVYGVDVTSLLAGIGVISVVIGLALQDSLKDAFRGFDIVSDNYYNVGDIVEIDGITGKVIDISFRSTKIQDIDTSNIISIANRNITQAGVVSEDIYFNIPLPYELPSDKAEKILASTIPEIKKDENVIEANFLGLNKLSDSAIEYLFAIKCKPCLKLQTRRNALKVIIKTLEAQKISIPYPQLEITKK